MPCQRAPFSENLDLVCEPRQGNRPANPGTFEKKFIEVGYFELFQDREKTGRKGGREEEISFKK